MACKTRFIEPYIKKPNGDYKSNLPFLIAGKKQTGVYFIKSDRSNKIVYIGYSESQLYRTIFRHFEKWTDIQKAEKTRFTYAKTGYKVRVIFTSPGRAATLEKYLILKLKPRDNELKYENYLTPAQEESAQKLLNKADTINKDEYPF